MDLITHIAGVGPTGAFNPGATTPAPYNVAHTGGVDGVGPGTATKNMAEIYNRDLLWRRALIAASGLAFDPTNWVQEVQALQALITTIASSIAGSKIQPIAAAVAANALTLTLNPTQLDFRSSALGSGVVNSRAVAAAVSLVVPAGATLGTVNAKLERIVLIALDNAGVIEPAVVNLSGGMNLDETTLISTTAISAAADFANVAYSTTARANLPFRVVGFIESNQAAAGTWNTAPSTIQGIGGQALAAMSSFGFGQTWQVVVRTTGVDYYNDTGRPIELAYSYVVYNAQLVTLAINLVSVDSLGNDSTTSGMSGTLKGTVPVGGRWSLSGTFNSIISLRELR